MTRTEVADSAEDWSKWKYLETKQKELMILMDMIPEQIFKFCDKIEISSCVQAKEWVENTPQKGIQTER